MAKNKAKSRSRSKKAAADQTPAPAPKSLNDDELQVLAEQHKGNYQTALAAKKKADADFKNACKRAKAELGKEAIDIIKTLIECDTPEGEARVIGRLKTTMTAARWAGVEVGTQFGMFTEEEAGGSRLHEEGKRAAMRGEACKAPADATADGQQEWIAGWHKGNEARNKGLAEAVSGDGSRTGRFGTPNSPLRQMTESAEAEMRARREGTPPPVGTEAATHHTA